MNTKNIKKINTSRVVTIIFVFCLMLLPFEQLSYIQGVAKAEETSEEMVDYTISSDEQTNTIITDSGIKESLLQLSMSPVNEKQEQKQKSELELLIEQINSIDLSLSDSSIDSEDIYNSFSNIKPEEKDNVEEHVQVEVKKVTQENNTYEYITEQTINRLKKIAEKPEEVDNPYEIGNTLYLSNNIGEAAAFYQEALRRTTPEDMLSSDDRAWLLFQTGNSLRTVDMLAAADYFQKLITEYPNSPWADYARVQSNVLTWYINEKPDEILNLK